MLKGFREFILRGNVVDLAIAVVIGAAFGALVKALVSDFLTPLLGILGVSGRFGDQKFTVHGSDFLWGDFVDNVVTFGAVAAAVYFLVVVPMNRIADLRAKPATDVPTRDCPECLSTVPKAARRCSFCTAAIEPVA